MHTIFLFTRQLFCFCFYPLPLITSTTTAMISNNLRRGIRRSVHVEDSSKQDDANAWVTQIICNRFLSTRSVDNAIQYMCDKPIGFYIFMRPEKIDSDKFAVLLREKDKTVRYSIRPMKITANTSCQRWMAVRDVTITCPGL